MVQPLWPWVVSFFNDAEDEVVFQRGRWLNLTLAWIALLAGAWWLARILPLVPWMVACGLVAFGCFLPQAVYFQPETIYYICFVSAWMCCWSLIQRNPLGWYVVLGVLGGIAHLAKASIIPLLAGYLVLSAVQWVFADRSNPDWSRRRHLVGVLLAGVIFTGITVPLLLSNHARFGSAMHSYPSYWMWQEDFGAESIPFMTRFNKNRESIPQSEIPSASKYFREHGWSHAATRLREGMYNKMGALLLPEGRIKKHRKDQPWKEVIRYRGMYPLLLGAMALVMCLLAWRSATGRERWLGFLRMGMVVGPVVGYWVMYGWYDVIGRGDRFMMSLYAPLILFPLLGGVALLSRGGAAARVVYGGVSAVVFVLLALRLVQVLSNPHFV